MKTLLGILLSAALIAGSVSGLLLLEDGKEYTYATETAANAGTGDVTHSTSGFSYRMKTKIQVSGKTINVKFTDMTFSEYVGTHDDDEHHHHHHAGRHWIFDETIFTPIGAVEPSFSLTVDDDGLFKSLVVPSDADVFSRNMARAWAAQLQVNTKEIKTGNHAFRSREQLIQGDCDVTYTVTEKKVIKTVSHTDDCENRVFRVLDDYRGMVCDKKEGLGYPASLATTVFMVEKEGSQYTVKKLVSTGTFVAQFFEEEGSTQFVHTNSTSVLVSVKASPGDISVSGTTITDLSYEFSDTEYKWDADRDLKAREPVFSTGTFYEEDQAKIQDGIKKGIAFQKTLIESLDKDPETLQKAHQYGINNILPAFYALDYNSLKGLAEQLFADKSEAGVATSNVYYELLSSAGTTAAALVIRDLVLENKFDNDRDAYRVLTGVPFHIRRPNTQLVKEYEKLLDIPKDRFVRSAVPLVIGHLIKVTCKRAGTPGSPEQIRCFKDWASTYVEKLWNKYKESTDRDEKAKILAAMTNIRFGGQSTVLKPLIKGEIDADDHQLRAAAMWAASWESMYKGDAHSFAMPIFADKKYPHEMRISALELIFYAKPTPAQLSTVVAVLYKERDYEVLNYASALFDRWAISINPCHEDTAHLAQYYLKFLRQFSNYETDYGFGVSKTYARQFHKKKYGYGGGFVAYVIGSHKSTTPLAVGFGLTSTRMNNYQSFMASIHLRVEGLAKGLIRKFKTTDPSTWKTADLEHILSGDMAIRERPDQPVRCGVSIMLKGSIVYHRVFDESDAGKDSKIMTLIEKFKDLGETYTINHQRALQLGSLLYEQPTNIGLPMGVMSSMTTIASLKATVQRGNARGLLYRDVKYELNSLTQGVRGAWVLNPWKKAAFGIINDRLYHLHIPRKFVIGVNPIKKELKLSVARPTYDHPWKVFAHSQTSVVVRGANMKGTYEGLKSHCSECENKVLVSRGKDHLQNRVFVDRENQKRGSYLFGEYFGCELNVKRGNTLANLAGAFAPYNKSPKTAWTSLMMGIRQVRAFLLYFPKTEQCGAMVRWSQSKNNPVNEIEISVRANMEENGERLFFRGRKWFIKALIKAKGEPEDRSYRVNVAYEFTPGNIKNSLKIQLNQAPLDALSIPAYSVCFALENEYPEFSREFLGYEESAEMAVTGKVLLQYGVGTTCSEADGEIRAKFRHSTTTEAREELKKKWYYEECMEEKATPAWKGRKTGLPVTDACMKTVYDATTARKYTWNVEFVKLTPRLSGIISKVNTAIKAGLLPYWDVDPEEVDVDGEVGPYMNVEAVFKDDEKALDIRLETRKGDEEFHDIPLNLDWTKRMRNLKFGGLVKRLFDNRIINPCIATTETVRTNDNVTYSYEPSSCWTLTSATCGPNPAYAVFSKKSASPSLPLAAIVYVGGHTVEFTPNGANVAVKINGANVEMEEDEQHEHSVEGVEIFKTFRWGSTYHIYSFLRVWVTYDGNFVEVVPAPSAHGQHCGICGNYNRNKHDEFTGKNEDLLTSAADLVKSWEWKC